jgi:V/A-type H+-transporting ATPase subunit A
VLREEAVRLLQKERELQEVAELVGTEALQDAERLTLESARLVREGFLRQSAADPVDASCPPDKAYHLLRMLLAFHVQAQAAVGRGVPLRAVLETGLPARLLGLVRIPAAEVAATCRALGEELTALLGSLEAE